MLHDAMLFLAGYIISWPAFGLLCLSGIFFEHIRCHGWAVIMGISAIVVGYYYFDVTLAEILWWVASYVAIGLVWSFWRYHRHVSDEAEDIRNSSSTGVYLTAKIEALAPGKNVDLITYWIIIWPFSAIESVVGDVINVVQSLVTKVFRSVYAKIYSVHVAGLQDLVDKQ
jgi:membrane protein implicated in regulation of membrane protease activity